MRRSTSAAVVAAVATLVALAVLVGCSPTTVPTAVRTQAAPSAAVSAPPAGSSSAPPAGSSSTSAPSAGSSSVAAPPAGSSSVGRSSDRTASPSAPPGLGIDLHQHSTTDPDSVWVVVDKAHPLDPVDYAPHDLVVVQGYEVRSGVAGDLTAMLAAARADGVVITLRSTYRSYGKQRSVYDGLVRQIGQAAADRVSARPGYSEHQTGLAVDIGSSTDDACDFDPCFATTAEGRWVAANAERFGFVVRYTPQNQAVTGYSPEAWHLRYVGRPLAAAMARAHVTTLEQVFGITGGSDYR